MSDNREHKWTPYLKHIISKTKTDICRAGIPVSNFTNSELWQVAWEAFCRAEKHYDVRKAKKAGAKFTTYLYKFVFFSLKKHIIANVALRIREQGYEDVSVPCTQEFFPAPDNIHHVDRNDLLKYAMHGLSEQEVRMLAMYYVEGMSYREIENIMGISYTTVRNHMTNCLTKLRRKVMVQDEDSVNSRM